MHMPAPRTTHERFCEPPGWPVQVHLKEDPCAWCWSASILLNVNGMGGFSSTQVCFAMTAR
jgi:hypothetical protein